MHNTFEVSFLFLFSWQSAGIQGDTENPDPGKSYTKAKLQKHLRHDKEKVENTGPVSRGVENAGSINQSINQLYLNTVNGSASWFSDMPCDNYNL